MLLSPWLIVSGCWLNRFVWYSRRLFQTKKSYFEYFSCYWIRLSATKTKNLPTAYLASRDGLVGLTNVYDGAKTLSTVTFSITTLIIEGLFVTFSKNDLFVTLSINDTRHSNTLSLSWVSRFVCCYSECHYADCHHAECRYAECPYAECRYAECRYAECRYAECRYADCHYAKCHYAECRKANPIFQNRNGSCFYSWQRTIKSLNKGCAWSHNSQVCFVSCQIFASNAPLRRVGFTQIIDRHGNVEKDKTHQLNVNYAKKFYCTTDKHASLLYNVRNSLL